MRLPNGSQAIIDLRKLTDYCLSPEHDDGKHKARLFEELLGVTIENAADLAAALKNAVLHEDAAPGKKDRYGQRYVVDFEYSGPGGKATIRSAWIVRDGETAPRLVTCYIK